MKHFLGQRLNLSGVSTRARAKQLHVVYPPLSPRLRKRLEKRCLPLCARANEEGRQVPPLLTMVSRYPVVDRSINMSHSLSDNWHHFRQSASDKKLYMLPFLILYSFVPIIFKGSSTFTRSSTRRTLFTVDNHPALEWR